MGRVMIHAGMPKTGSSSIQEWLRERIDALHAEGLSALRARVDDAGRVSLRSADTGTNMNSGRVVRYAREHPRERRRVAEEFLDQLDAAARSERRVLLSSEGFAQWLWRRDELFVSGLDELGEGHDVVVAYYVRPQHTALEAAWRQWGFRRPAPPSEFLEERSEQLDYLGTFEFMREAAPRVRFVPRPFRRDLLAGGDVVVDFAREFLGLEVGQAPPPWRNRAVPLELVNLLHGVPPGRLWPSDAARDVNPRLEWLRALSDRIDLPASSRAEHSRLVLQEACHERFEADNVRLCEALGWATDEWVPAVAPERRAELGEASFARLDELWHPHASAAELALLHGALAELLRDAEPGRAAADVREGAV